MGLGDTDELLRQVERLVADRDWDGLVDLRDRCERAVERGFQLWGVAAHADYRLVLNGPADFAAAVVAAGRGRFALGPLAEVAASVHQWRDIGPHLPPGPEASVVAHELAARGVDLSAAEPTADPSALEIPLRLARCEPTYPVAAYAPTERTVDDPPWPTLAPFALPDTAPPSVDDPAAIDALVGVTRVWQTQSNGRASAGAVEGGAAGAIRSLGAPRARAAPITTADAMAHLAWAGASGGAHGRRRGLAAGRFEAWWVMAALAGALDDWPIGIEDLDAIAVDLDWYLWDADEPATGWSLRLAVEDRDAGLAWAVAAIDAA